MKYRWRVLIACALVIASILLLAPSLESLHFEPARPVSRAADFPRPSILGGIQLDQSTSTSEIILIWLALVIPAILVALLLPPALRRRVIQQLIRFALFMLALVLALRYRLIKLPEVEGADLAAVRSGWETSGGPSEGETFTVPMLPPWVTYLISLFVVAILALGTIVVYRFWHRSHTRRSSSLPMIAAIASHSLDELAEGQQWGDVVIEAYARMTDVLRVSRGMQRAASGTPREFASQLARKGLPASAVDELTRLFEAARYGGAIADEAARLRAGTCLESILQACKAAA